MTVHEYEWNIVPNESEIYLPFHCRANFNNLLVHARKSKSYTQILYNICL